MGTWGLKQFENDEALDFTNEVLVSGSDAVKNAIGVVAAFPEDSYLECPECNRALVAVELIAAAGGHPSSDLSDEMKNWVAKYGGEILSLKDSAIVAIERILRKSELLDLWTEGDELPQWKETVQDLLERLK